MQKPRVTACFALALCLAAGETAAHTAAAGIGDFYAGFLHPLTALEHVLPFLAIGLLAGQQGQKAQAALPLFLLALLIAGFVGLWVAPNRAIDLLNVLSAVVLGALVATAWVLPLWVFYVMAGLFGTTHGIANGTAVTPDIKPYLFIPGVAAAGLLVCAYAMMAVDKLLRKNVGWMKIAVRVAGSWIAAIGILVLAVTWKALAN
jgi:urease accessory protein